MEINIVEEKTDKNTLYVTFEIKLRKYCSEKRVIINDSFVKKELEKDYDIISVIKSNTISNSKKGGHKQSGTWIFKLKPQPSSIKKPLQKKNIRGRMSKIAQEIEKTRNEEECLTSKE